MLAGLLAGTILGLIFGEKMAAFRLLGDLFITLLQMAAIPLIFCNVITAIARLPDFTTMRRIGVMIMAYYIITMACAAAIDVQEQIELGRSCDHHRAGREAIGGRFVHGRTGHPRPRPAPRSPGSRTASWCGSGTRRSARER